MRRALIIPLLLAVSACDRSDPPTKAAAAEGGGFTEIICLGWCKSVDTDLQGASNQRIQPTIGIVRAK